MVCLLGERGAYTTGEIGEVVAVSYTAVSHIVRKALIHSQIKMWPQYPEVQFIVLMFSP